MLELTNSAFMVGLIGFAAGVPVLIISIPTGAILDRVNRKTVLLATQTVLMLVGVMLALLVVAGIVQPWHLLVGAILNGSLMAVAAATRQTIVPHAVAASDLPRAMGTLAAGQNAARILGPSVAGVIIGVFGVAGSFVFQASVLALACLLTLPLSSAISRRKASIQSANKLTAGLRYIHDNPLMLSLILIGAFPMLFAFPYLTLLPIFARDILQIGPDGLGILMTASGIGAVSGGLLTSVIADRIQRLGLFIILGMAGYSVILTSFAFANWTLAALMLLALSSATSSLCLSLTHTLIQTHVEDDVRGRVTGVMMLTTGLFSIGALPMGMVASYFGAQVAVGLGAAISACCVLLVGLKSTELRAI